MAKARTPNGGATREPGEEVARPAAAEVKHRPAAELRRGRIKAVVWRNETEGGVRFNVNVRRIYKREGSNTWEETDSFSRDDLPVVEQVVHEAWLWIYEHANS